MLLGLFDVGQVFTLKLGLNVHLLIFECLDLIFVLGLFLLFYGFELSPLFVYQLIQVIFLLFKYINLACLIAFFLQIPFTGFFLQQSV